MFNQLCAAWFACGWLGFGLKCKLLFDVFWVDYKLYAVNLNTSTLLAMIVVKHHGGLHHNREYSSCWPGEDGSVLLTISRSKENSLSSRRRRLDIDEKNHLHCTCPMGRLSISRLLLSPPDLTFLAARSATLSAINETPSAWARYAIGWQLLVQVIHDDVPHLERGMSAAVAASERMQVLG